MCYYKNIPLLKNGTNILHKKGMIEEARLKNNNH